MPFIPFVEILEAALGQTSDLAAFRQVLGNEASEIARLVSRLRLTFRDITMPTELPDLPAQQSRRILFDAVTDLVKRVSNISPAVFLFDDLHWADEGTLLLLSHLVQFLPTLPILVLGTYRDSELDSGGHLTRALDEMLRLHLVDCITLQGFSENIVAKMLQALSGQMPPDSIAKLFHSETGGNPFFVEELFKHLVEQGKLFESNGMFCGDLRPGDGDVPQSAKLVIGRRLAKLGEETKRVLGVAATIGRSFTFELLRAALQIGADPLIEQVEKVEKSGLLSSTIQYPDTRFEFSHEIVRQTVLSQLSAAPAIPSADCGRD